MRTSRQLPATVLSEYARACLTQVRICDDGLQKLWSPQLVSPSSQYPRLRSGDQDLAEQSVIEQGSCIAEPSRRPNADTSLRPAVQPLPHPPHPRLPLVSLCAPNNLTFLNLCDHTSTLWRASRSLRLRDPQMCKL